MSPLRCGILSFTLGWAAVCATAHGQSVPVPVVQFDVPAQSMEQALTDLAAQANLRIVFFPETVKGVTGSSVKGAYTPEAALRILLSNSALKYSFIDARTVTISSPADERPAAVGARAAAADSMLLAQASNDRPQAPAPSSEESAARLEEIVVTAQKRAERLIDVPISIVALSADELEKRKVTRLDDLMMFVPGLAAQSNGGYVRKIVLRGISNGQGSSSLIGLYLDEASVTSAPTSQLDLRTYDLERIEVLRGPQGTLYGEGSVGGTIRFITKDPVLSGFGARADAAALFTEDGEPGQRVEGAVNVPLIEDRLGLRISGTYDHAGGWIDQPAAGREDFNGQNLTNARIKGLWKPTAQLTVNAMAVVHRNNGSNNNGEDSAGNYTQVFNLTTTPRIEDDYDLYNLTLSYDFAGARLLNTLTHLDQETDVRDVGNPIPFSPPGFPQLGSYASFLRDNRMVTEELRLTSTGSGPWQWTLGGFYRDARFDNNQLSRVGLQGPPGTPVPAPLRFLTRASFKSWAAFGDTRYKLTERFTVGAGLRYFRDDQESIAVLPAPGVQADDFTSVNPRVYLQYKLTADINGYASAAKGFRSGGFNTAVGQPPYDPESVWTYEVGAKMALLGGRLGVDTAVFYSDYTDYQISGQLPPPALPLAFTRNAGNARVKGVELGLAWRPVDQWELGLNGNYLNSRFYEINVVASAYRVGDPLDLVPKYDYSVWAQRDFRWSGKPGYARLDYSEHGRSTFRSRNIGPWYYSESDLISMLNFDLGLQWSSGLSLGLFAQNLLNERGFIDPFSISGAASRPRPRTVGIEFGVTF